MLFLPDDRNLLLVWPDADVAEAVTKIQFGVLAIAALAVAVVTAQRWRTASRPRRRALLPSLGGSLSGVLYAANLITLTAESPSTLLMSLLNAALLTVPAALLWGLLRSRLARAGLPDLFRELGTLRGARLEAGLAETLGDPELVLAYRVPDQHAFIDGRGQPVDLPGPEPDGARRRSSATVASWGCWSTTRRSTRIRSSSAPSPRPPRSRSTTRGCKRSPRTGWPSCERRASVSSPPATRSGGGSSAISTTARSSGSCPWRCSCG